MWFHWEYYASFAPRWNKRMAEFKYKRNNEKKTIEFDNDDIMEDFYQNMDFWNLMNNRKRFKIQVQVKLIKKHGNHFIMN